MSVDPESAEGEKGEVQGTQPVGDELKPATPKAEDAKPEEPKLEKSKVEPAKAAPSVIFKCDGSRFTKFSGTLEPYNFRKPVSISKASMRNLETNHARLAQNLSERLASFFRMDCTVKVSKLGNVPYSKFKEGLEGLTHLTLFQVESLRGIGIVNFGVPLAMSIVDRLLGGMGKAPTEGSLRALTEIETALVEDVVLLVVGEWASLWCAAPEEANPRCIGVETSGAFLQTSSADATTLVIHFEMLLGELNSSFQLAIPFSMVESHLKKVDKSQRRDESETSKKMEWYEPYDGISVPITAEWRVREILVRDVLKFKEGDVLEMPRNLIDKTYVRLSEKPEFIGTVGIENGRVAVQLAQQILLE
jgi:flagellar motor switch protein FliM